MGKFRFALAVPDLGRIWLPGVLSLPGVRIQSAQGNVL